MACIETVLLSSEDCGFVTAVISCQGGRALAGEDGGQRRARAVFELAPVCAVAG